MGIRFRRSLRLGIALGASACALQVVAAQAAPSITAAPSLLKPGQHAEIDVIAAKASICRLRLVGPSGAPRERYTAHLRLPFLRFRWKTNRHATRGPWRAVVSCGSNRDPLAAGLVGVEMRVTGRRAGRGPLALRGSMRKIDEALPAPRRASETVTGLANPEAGIGSAGCVPDAGGYCAGYCTHFVWTKRHDLSHLGNAAEWLTGARARGIPTGTAPVVGAAAWWSGSSPYVTSSAGHIAYVIAVGAGTVTFEEMNGPAGWNAIDRQTMPLASRYAPQGYIYGGSPASAPSPPPLPPPFRADFPVTGKWTPSEPDTIGVVQSALTPGAEMVWRLRNSNTPGAPDITVNYGGYGDLPVVGDWNGDGVDGIGVYEPAKSPGGEARWLLRNTPTPGGPEIEVKYGGYGELPVSGDWDGNGTDTVGVYLPAASPGADGTWYLRNSNSYGDPNMLFLYGGYGDLPAAGDWDGNGTDTIGVYAPASAPGGEATWFLRNSNTPGAADALFKYGGYTDLPVSGDWDGNGTGTVGVYLPAVSPGGEATWFLRDSNTPGEPDLPIFRYGGGQVE